MRWLQQFIGHRKFLRCHLHSSQRKSIVNYLYSCHTVHTTSVHYKCNYTSNKTSTQEILKPDKFLLNTKDGTTELATATSAQHRQSVTLAARIVNKSPRRIQPYLKLIRMDKPIGEIKIIYCIIFLQTARRISVSHEPQVTTVV